MKTLAKRLVFMLGLVLAAGPALADKPASPGNAKPKKQAAQAQPAAAAPGATAEDVNLFFNSDRRTILGDYYARSYASGHCPPGLAKKNNGCMPPGQAKKWHRGQYLPHDAVYYDLPSVLLHELGRTPEGAKIIQVGTGLLLINAATGLILDAMEIPQ